VNKIRKPVKHHHSWVWIKTANLLKHHHSLVWTKTANLLKHHHSLVWTKTANRFNPPLFCPKPRPRFVLFSGLWWKVIVVLFILVAVFVHTKLWWCFNRFAVFVHTKLWWCFNRFAVFIHTKLWWCLTGLLILFTLILLEWSYL
jgi:hypothetical protein